MEARRLAITDLPDDSLLVIARYDLGAGLALRSTCLDLHIRLHSFGKDAAMRRKAEVGRSAAELSLVNRGGKSELDLAAERVIARLAADGIAPPTSGGAPVVLPGGAMMAAANAAAAATYTASVCAGAQGGGWFVPSSAAAQAAPSRAAAPTEPVMTGRSAELQEAPRRRRTLSGLLSKLQVGNVR